MYLQLILTSINDANLTNLHGICQLTYYDAIIGSFISNAFQNIILRPYEKLV